MDEIKKLVSRQFILSLLVVFLLCSYILFYRTSLGTYITIFDADNFGSMYQRDNVNVTTIAVKDDWYHVVNFLEGSCGSITFSGSTLIIGSTAGGCYRIGWAATIFGTKDTSIELTLTVNDIVKIETVHGVFCDNANAPYNLSGIAIINLLSGDVVKLKVRNRTSTANVTIKHANVCLQRL